MIKWLLLWALALVWLVGWPEHWMIDVAYQAPLYIRYSSLGWSGVTLFGLMGLAHAVGSRRVTARGKEYEGHVVRDHEMALIEERFAAWERMKQWQIQRSDRNQVWIGRSLLTGEDVFLEKEDLFKGMVIIGAAGTGKTSRYMKVVAKQLMDDDRTSFLYFSLKAEDAAEFKDWLANADRKALCWSMASLIDLTRSNSGALEPGKFSALVEGAMHSLGHLSNDKFWTSTFTSHLLEYVTQLAFTHEADFGSAYRWFHETIQGKKNVTQLEQSLLATGRAIFQDFTHPMSRVALLYAPRPGGIHVGPLYLKPGRKARCLLTGRIHFGEQTMLLPSGVYEVPRGARAPWSWEQILQGYSFILPPPGSASSGELFALNLIKQSALAWIAEDVASADSRLLRRDAADRHRLVFLQDEGHNFINLEGQFNDIMALQQFRQAGFVSILASQSFSAFRKSKIAEINDNLFANLGCQIYLAVQGKERKAVIETIGKCKMKRLERNYSRSQRHSGRDAAMDDEGNVMAAGPSVSVTENVRETESDFITAEDYKRLPAGVAICVRQAQRDDVIYCPYHDRVRFRWAS